MKSTFVVCSCGWKGRRVHRQCECYEHPFGDCTPFGRCPKCDRVVESRALRKERRKWEDLVSKIDWTTIEPSTNGGPAGPFGSRA